MEPDLQFTAAKELACVDSQRAFLLNGQAMPSDALHGILETVAECAYTLDRKPRVFVDREGRWLAGNDAAADFLKNPAAGFYFDRGALKAATGSERCLQTLLKVNEHAESCVIDIDNGAHHVIFQAAAFDDQIVCITAVDASDDIAPQFVDLSSAFALTQSEDKVVRALLAGNSPQEVADQLGVSINTVRAHLRHCYEKMGVTHREELWRRTYPYRIT